MSAAASTAPTRRVRGPSALGSDPRRFLSLTWTLAVTDFKLRFFGSVLGYVWTLMRPLLIFAVLLVLFTEILDLTAGVVFYPQALLLGVMLFNFMAEVTSQSVRSILDREPIVRRVEFPRLAVPLAVVLQGLFNLIPTILVVLAFLLAAGGEVRASWLQIVPLVVLLTGLATGLSMLLSMLYIRFRDVQPIWDVFLQAMFYLSPVFFTVEIVRERFDESVVRYLMLNPFAAILQQARHAVIDPSHPSAADAAGGSARLLMPLAIGIAIFALGAWVFRRGAPQVAEDL